MPVIMTVHIAQSSSRCARSQCSVIIHALAPVIGPYMSRAVITIQVHEITGTSTRSTTTGMRSPRNTDSSRVGSLGTAPGKRRILTIVPAAFVLPCQAESLHTTPRGACEGKTIRGWMTGVVEMYRLGRIRIDAFDALGGHVHETRGLHGPFRSAAIEVNWCRLHAEKRSDESRE